MKKMTARRCLALALTLLMVLGMMPTAWAFSPQVNDIRMYLDERNQHLSYGTKIEMTVGETLTLSIDPVPPSGSTEFTIDYRAGTGGTTDWISADSTTAKVEKINDADIASKFKLTALKAGTTQITRDILCTEVNPANSANPQTQVLHLAWTVEVKEALTSVTISDAPATATAGDTIQLTANPNVTDGTTYAWKTGNNSEIIGDADKQTVSVKVKEAGTATVEVTATNNSKSVSASATITVNAPVDTHKFTVAISSDNSAPTVGTGIILTAEVTPVSGATRPVQLIYDWKIDDNTIVEFTGSTNNTTCQARAHKAGTATVTLTVTDGTNSDNKASATYKIPVTSIPTSISLSQNTLKATTGSTRNNTLTANVTGTDSINVTWESSNTAVVDIQENQGRRVVLNFKQPGEAVITASINGQTAKCDVTVTGVRIDGTIPTLVVGETVDLPQVTLVELSGRVTWSGKTVSDRNIIRVNNNTTLTAVRPGVATLVATAGGVSAEIQVTVASNQAEDIRPSTTYGVNKPLAFNTLLSDFNDRCNATTHESLSYVTALQVTPKEGILHLGYRSPDDTGSGVAVTSNYYYDSKSGAKLSDITFAPSATYTGATATITYTGVSTGNRTFTGKIIVKLLDVNDQVAALTGTAGQPVKFGSRLFTQACQSATGQSLKYISFALPSENRGTLYYDYTDANNYGYKVAASDQFKLNQLDRLAFVPAEGYHGTVTIAYTGYSTSNTRFVGQIEVTVSQSRDDGPVYNTPQGSHVVFNDNQFNDYSRSMTGRTLSYIQFPSLPDVNQGVLYYNYRSSSSTGNRVYTNTSFYHNSRTPRINQIAFAPASGFVGTVEIPFNAWDEYGSRFSGILQVNVRGSGSGDLTYTCTVGSSVKLVSSHFNDLCLELTGKSLNYVTFTSLPSTSYGSLYSNRNNTSSSSGTRVNTSTKYYRNSLGNLSFWSTGGYTGTVDIPFVGHATGSDDETFTGTLTIEILSRGQGMLSYTADSKDPAVFDISDFNDLCWDETGKNLNYVLFDLPSSSQGTLYYNYSANSGSYSSKVSSSTRYYRSGGNLISRVSFVPASGYLGTTFVTFTGYANDGTRFDGTVQITVSAAAPDATVRYATSYAPITFSAEDFRRAYGSGTLSSVRFSSLPNGNDGRLYYQYTSPNHYSWEASTGTDYKASGSPALGSLTFVPRANFAGTVTIPYVATNTNNKTYTGQVVITVSAPTSSAYFTDMYGYSPAAIAAVDYLRENGVVQGMTSTQFAPKNSIRRGDFALMIYRAFNFSSASGVQSFADVSPNDYYAQAVNALRALNIVTGTGGNRFDPNGSVTRQDAMLMVQRALQVSGWNVSGGSGSLYYYPDYDQVSGYAENGLSAIVSLGLLPTDSGRLEPKSPLVRVDMAQVLHRALTY